MQGGMIGEQAQTRKFGYYLVCEVMWALVCIHNLFFVADGYAFSQEEHGAVAQVIRIITKKAKVLSDKC